VGLVQAEAVAALNRRRQRTHQVSPRPRAAATRVASAANAATEAAARAPDAATGRRAIAGSPGSERARARARARRRWGRRRPAPLRSNGRPRPGWREMTARTRARDRNHYCVQGHREHCFESYVLSTPRRQVAWTKLLPEHRSQCGAPARLLCTAVGCPAFPIPAPVSAPHGGPWCSTTGAAAIPASAVHCAFICITL
jgi:hypothetical protein